MAVDITWWLYPLLLRLAGAPYISFYLTIATDLWLFTVAYYMVKSKALVVLDDSFS